MTHRWQPGTRTPCGLLRDAVRTNTGRVGDEGVTCRRCLAATQRVTQAPGARHPEGPTQLRLEE